MEPDQKLEVEQFEKLLEQILLVPKKSIRGKKVAKPGKNIPNGNGQPDGRAKHPEPGR
ncbi:MAG: hypothetical protein IH944_06650 [Armatimonadetes bacterium]|nr:hypothetical protein [Armatimonadota bacterium]